MLSVLILDALYQQSQLEALFTFLPCTSHFHVLRNSQQQRQSNSLKINSYHRYIYHGAGGVNPGTAQSLRSSKQAEALDFIIQGFVKKFGKKELVHRSAEGAKLLYDNSAFFMIAIEVKFRIMWRWY